MSDLVEFLRARLDEDAQVAQAAQERDDHVSLGPVDLRTGAPSHVTVRTINRWHMEAPDDPEIGRYESTVAVPGGVRMRISTWSKVLSASEVGEHVARHDPARVLREVEAKRRMLPHLVVDGHALDHCDRCMVLRLHAEVYADHSDYDEEWRP